jgi:hypothetical protein
MEIDAHLVLDLDHYARLEGRNKPLQLDRYGISADPDGRENVSAVRPRISRFGDGSRFILKKYLGAHRSVTGGISNCPHNRS